MSPIHFFPSVSDAVLTRTDGMLSFISLTKARSSPRNSTFVPLCLGEIPILSLPFLSIFYTNGEVYHAVSSANGVDTTDLMELFFEEVTVASGAFQV